MSNVKLQKSRRRTGIPADLDGSEANRYNGLRGHDQAYKLHCELVADRSTGSDNAEMKKSDFFVKGKRLEDSLQRIYSALNGQCNLQQRDHLVGSGSSYDFVGDHGITRDEMKTIRLMKRPLILDTANGETRATCEILAYVKDLDLCVKAIILSGSPPLLSLGMLVKGRGMQLDLGPVWS